jgi:hypothetical protein
MGNTDGCKDEAAEPAITPADEVESDGGDGGDGGGGDSGEEATCAPGDLCDRTIDECGYDFDLATCEAWYADPGNCADMDGYLDCNCDCLEQDVCDSYMACGESCYEDFCA